MKNKIILVLLFMTMFTCVATAQSFSVIVNAANTTTSLSAKEVTSLFLKKKKKWPNGKAVTPVDLNSNSDIRSQFSKKILHKNTAAIRSYWQQAAFSGTATAPPEKENEQAVIEYVKSHEGAIGYISTQMNLSGVKILKVE